jgi:hypothetical protein
VWNYSRSRSYFTTDSMSVYRAPLWDLRSDIPVGMLLSKSCGLVMCGALSDERTGLQFAVQSLNSPIRAQPITIICCLIWDSPDLEGQVLVYPPGTGWLSCAPGHWGCVKSLVLAIYISEKHKNSFCTLHEWSISFKSCIRKNIHIFVWVLQCFKSIVSVA